MDPPQQQERQRQQQQRRRPQHVDHRARTRTIRVAAVADVSKPQAAWGSCTPTRPCADGTTGDPSPPTESATQDTSRPVCSRSDVASGLAAAMDARSLLRISSERVSTRAHTHRHGLTRTQTPTHMHTHARTRTRTRTHTRTHTHPTTATLTHTRSQNSPFLSAHDLPGGGAAANAALMAERRGPLAGMGGASLDTQPQSMAAQFQEADREARFVAQTVLVDHGVVCRQR